MKRIISLIKRRELLLFSLLGVLLFHYNSPPSVGGQAISINPRDVIINEVAWMGTTISSNDEWIELWNSTDKDIDITGWTLKVENGNPNFEVQGVIKAKDFFLLERNNDDAVLGIDADQVYSGSLNDHGEVVSLFDANMNLIDSTGDDSSGWLAGESENRLPMHREVDLTWGTSGVVDGTPRESNFPFYIYSNDDFIVNTDTYFNVSQLINLSNPDLSYALSFGDASPIVVDPFILEDDIAYQYLAPGLYFPYLTVIDETGVYSAKIYEKRVEIYEGDFPPIAYFEVLNQEFFTDMPISFDASSSFDPDGSTLSYEWEFKPESIYYTNNNLVEYFYDLPGQYEVKLIVSNNVGEVSDVYSELIQIEEKPDVTEGIVINELVSDPVSGENEWIELYNYTDNDITLSGWEIRDGSSLISSFETLIAAGEYFVYEISSYKLNNGGEQIILLNKDGVIVDDVTYGDWDDGLIDDNARYTEVPNSLARNIDGIDTNVDINDFSETSMTTKGTSNLIEIPSEEEEDDEGGDDDNNNNDDNDEDQDDNEILQYSNDIFINEVVANPTGSDEEEWIELFNNGLEDINLENWSLDDSIDSGSEPFVFDNSFIIKANDFLVINREQSNLSLNNYKEWVHLKIPNGEIISSIYLEKSEESISYARTDSGSYQWTTKLTKGKENVIEKPSNFLFITKSGNNDILKHDRVQKNNIKSISEEEPVEHNEVNLSDNSEVIAGDSTKEDNNDLVSFSIEQDWIMKAMVIGEVIILLYLIWQLSEFVLKRLLLNKH